MREIKGVVRQKAYELDLALWAVFDAARSLRRHREDRSIRRMVAYASDGDSDEESRLWAALVEATAKVEEVQSALTREISVAYREGDIAPPAAQA